MGNVAELVREDTRVAYLRFDVTMRVTVDPVVDARVRDIVA